MVSFRAKIHWGRPRKREKKKIVPMSSYPTCNREFQKNSKKFKKHYCGFFSSQNRLERPRKRENKKNRSDELLRDP